MAKWTVVSTLTFGDVEAETSQEAIARAGELSTEADHWMARTSEEGWTGCEVCGKPAPYSDGEGIPLCHEHYRALLTAPPSEGGSGMTAQEADVAMAAEYAAANVFTGWVHG